MGKLGWRLEENKPYLGALVRILGGGWGGVWTCTDEVHENTETFTHPPG